MKKLLSVIPILLLVSVSGCVNTELLNVKKHPSIPACCEYLNSHPDSKDNQIVVQLYDQLWSNAKDTLKNSNVDSAAICYLNELVDYLFDNKQYVIRLEIDSLVDVKSVKEYEFDIITLYDILNKSIHKTLSERGIEHTEVDVNDIIDMDRSQIHCYPRVVQKGLQRAFDRVLSDSVVIVADGSNMGVECPLAKVSYKVVNCELPLGEYQVPLYTNVISEKDKFAKRAAARMLQNQGIEVGDEMLNGDMAWQIGIQFDVTLTVPGSDSPYTYSFFAPYIGTDNGSVNCNTDSPYAFQTLSCFYDFENTMDSTLFVHR